ncbi:MAG TPA: AmpG family muropeptide MFS transporter [Gemmatimonadaceae bacterium]|nr:AmpG family muropeptide MFS transporter [Gemmatimonadaceae bacterium]
MQDAPGTSPLRTFGQPKMAALLVLGFSSGLPLFLTSRTLQAWMTTADVDLKTIGLFSLVGLPYSLKFIWAPLLDRYVPPFLGRRRGWLLITQVLLMLTIAAMSVHDPRLGLQALALNALLLAFFSASQDIAVDAYRADVLQEREMGAGAATFVMGYRIALIVTGSLALVLADRLSWPMVYLLLSALMLIGMVTAFIAPEPVLRDAPPQTLAQAVGLPFKEFFQRSGVLQGFVVLLFVVLYKFSDSLAGNMTTPFLLKTGFTQTEIGVVLGGAGIIATIVGVVAAGGVIAKLGINKSLWIFAILQGVSNLAYYALSLIGKDRGAMIVTILIENFCVGLVTAVTLAFMMSVTNKRFSATQFALLSSLAAASRDILVAPGGGLAQSLGWPTFFLVTVAAILPAMVMLPFVAPWGGERPTAAAPHDGETVPAAA